MPKCSSKEKVWSRRWLLTRAKLVQSVKLSRGVSYLAVKVLVVIFGEVGVLTFRRQIK